MVHKVSIIIAAYNIQDYIARCLNSVINQTYKNLDIIIVNDGSTDETLSIIQSYENNDKRIKIINQNNMGLLASRKIGFTHATGDYVLFIDGDDWLEINAIQVMYEAMMKDDFDIIQCKYYMKYDNGKSVKDLDKTLGAIEPSTLIDRLLLCDINHNVWTKLIKMDYIKVNDIHFMNDITFGEDLAFTYELFIRNPKVCVIDDCLYNYYQRSNSLTNEISPKVLEINKVLQYISQDLIKRDLYNNYTQHFDYFVYRHSYLTYRNFIFYSKSELGKEILAQWRNYGIDIVNNNFYKKKISIKGKISEYFYSHSLLSYSFAYLAKKIQCFMKKTKHTLKPYLKPFIKSLQYEPLKD